MDVNLDLLIFEDFKHFPILKDELEDQIKRLKNNKTKSLLSEETSSSKELSNLLRHMNIHTGVKMISIPPEYASKVEQATGTENQLYCVYSLDYSGVKQSHIWCDGEKRFLKPGELIIFDQTRQHYFENKDCDDCSVFLMFSIPRPKHVNPGIITKT